MALLEVQSGAEKLAGGFAEVERMETAFLEDIAQTSRGKGAGLLLPRHDWERFRSFLSWVCRREGPHALASLWLVLDVMFRKLQLVNLTRDPRVVEHYGDLVEDFGWVRSSTGLEEVPDGGGADAPHLCRRLHGDARRFLEIEED
jgi:hypothetical protein